MSDSPIIAIRSATPADTQAVTALDPDPARAGEVTAAIESSRCLVADWDGRIVGFAIRDRFFGNEFLELLLVEPSVRRRGVGTALVRRLESESSTEKLFTSTNASNVAMRRLCDRLGFVPSGRIENIDANDAELIYLKRLHPPPPRPDR